MVEILAIHSRSENLILSVVYRQPDNSTKGYPSKAKEFKQGITKLHEKISQLDQPVPDIIIGGDFNLPHAEWPTGNPTSGCFSEEKKCCLFSMTFHKNSISLNMSNHQPTKMETLWIWYLPTTVT